MTDRFDAPPSFDELPPVVARWAERRRRVARQVAEQPATEPAVFAARLVEQIAAAPAEPIGRDRNACGSLGGHAARPARRLDADVGDQPIMSLTTPSQ